MEYVTAQGVDVPALGLGTWKLKGARAREVVEEALAMGYRHLDTAQMYGNEAEVGDAIRRADVDRDEVFLTTKIWRSNLSYEKVHSSVAESLEKLDAGYIDLLLIHWPRLTGSHEGTIRAMNELQDKGSVREIGVSNFSVDQMETARGYSETPIVANQVQYHPLTEQREVLQHCVEEDLVLTAYSPLAKGRVLDEQTLREIGARYGKSPAQVALRWLIQQPQVAAIPKASSRAHLRENLEIFDFELTTEEMEEIFYLKGGMLGKLKDLLRI